MDLLASVDGLVTGGPPPPPPARDPGDYRPAPAPAPLRVSVVDVTMPFGSMVAFIFLWALAAIPAFLLLGLLAFFVVAVFGAMVH